MSLWGVRWSRERHVRHHFSGFQFNVLYGAGLGNGLAILFHQLNKVGEGDLRSGQRLIYGCAHSATGPRHVNYHYAVSASIPVYDCGVSYHHAPFPCLGVRQLHPTDRLGDSAGYAVGESIVAGKLNAGLKTGMLIDVVVPATSRQIPTLSL